VLLLPPLPCQGTDAWYPLAKDHVSDYVSQCVTASQAGIMPPTSTALPSTTRIEPIPAQVIPEGTIGSPPCEYSNL
jgi:hypothetical protein